MKIIDILIFSICVFGLLYFIVARIKYSDKLVFKDKIRRLSELQNKINLIKEHNRETLKLICSIDINENMDDDTANKLIRYSEYEDILPLLEKESAEIKKYLKKVRIHTNK